MNNKVWYYFDLAGKLTVAKNNSRSFLLGSIGLRKDGALVSAINSISQTPNRQLHSEYRLSRKLDKGSIVFVARVRLLNGEFAEAKPCFSCEKALRNKGVKRVFYTISHNEYGVIDL